MRLFFPAVKFGAAFAGVKPPAHSLGGGARAGDLVEVDLTGDHGLPAGKVLGEHGAGGADEERAAVVDGALAVVADLVGGEDVDAVVVGPGAQRNVPAFAPVGGGEARGGVGAENELGAFEGEGLGYFREMLLKAELDAGGDLGEGEDGQVVAGGVFAALALAEVGFFI